MNIVFLIGNGFDLNLGLRTKYSDFYKSYYSQRKDDERKYIQDFLSEIENDAEEWSDFELSFGKYARNFNTGRSEEYIQLWEDIHLSLAAYIDLQQEAIQTKGQISPKMGQYLIYPDNFLARGARIKFNRLRNRTGNGASRISVINFNYTNSFERLYGWKGRSISLPNSSVYGSTLDTVIHVHGTTHENMILGVDNSLQIRSQDGLDKDQRILNRVVKPIANKNTQTLREQDCATCISGANLICIYGMSLGATDKTWWHLIGERLLSAEETMVIIFARNSGVPDVQGYLAVEQRNEKIKKFLERAGLKNTTQLYNKIEVSFDSGIFDDFAGIAQPLK